MEFYKKNENNEIEIDDLSDVENVITEEKSIEEDLGLYYMSKDKGKSKLSKNRVETIKKSFWSKKLKNRMYFNLAIMIFVLFAVVMIIFITPSNRYARAIKKADAYYATQSFEKALGKYQKVIKIKPESVKGYFGVVLSSLALGEDNIEEKYVEYADSLLNSEKLVTEEKEEVEEFFLLAPGIVTDKEELMLILEKAYGFLNNDNELKAALADSYYGYAVDVVSNDPQTGLEYFLKAMDYSADNKEYVEAAKLACENYISSLCTLDKYEEAMDVLENYKDNLISDYSETYAKILLAQSLYLIKCDLMEHVIDAVKPYYDQFSDSFSKETIEAFNSPVFRVLEANWDSMLELDGSAEAETLAFSFASDAYIYADGGFKNNYTGVGAGLYTYGDVYTYEDGSQSQGYYFYYGQYKDGQRSGYGIIFAKSGDDSYMAFEGEWKDDAPNGFGVRYEKDMTAYSSLAEYKNVLYGNWNNGLENGTMTEKVILNAQPDTYFEGSYEAKNGEVDALPGELINYGIVDAIPEGRKLIAILPSQSDGDEYFIPVYIDENSIKGVWGFYE